MICGLWWFGSCYGLVVLWVWTLLISVCGLADLDLGLWRFVYWFVMLYSNFFGLVWIWIRYCWFCDVCSNCFWIWWFYLFFLDVLSDDFCWWFKGSLDFPKLKNSLKNLMVIECNWWFWYRKVDMRVILAMNDGAAESWPWTFFFTNLK